MPIPNTIHTHLQQHGVRYSVLTHLPTITLPQTAEATGIPPRRIARTVMLADNKGVLMAVLPSDHLLDFTALSALLNRNMEPIALTSLTETLFDCAPGSCPPLGAAYNLEEIVDAELLEQPEIYFEPGSHTELVRMSGDEFRLLKQNARIGRFSQPLEALRVTPEDSAAGDQARLRETIEHYTPARIKRSIEEIHELPAMPSTAHAILSIYNDPKADVDELARVVELDPALAAQVTRYASSPLYGYRGKLSSIKEAISRVLGFDRVMNMAMGIAIGKSFQIAPDGPLGLNAYWRHAVYCGALCERLARAVPSELRPRLGTAYLAGLLHNIGRLLLGQFFQTEHFLLNRFMLANPELPIIDVERFVLGVGHEQIGGWLMQAWHMPAELIVATRWHHTPEYWGEHAIYPQLVLLANHLLKRYGIGDAESGDLPGEIMQMLELTEAQVETIVEKVMDGSTDIDDLVRQLAG